MAKKPQTSRATLRSQWPAWAKAALFYKPLSLPGFCNTWAVLFGTFSPKALKMQKWQTVNTFLDEVLKTPLYMYLKNKSPK